MSEEPVGEIDLDAVRLLFWDCVALAFALALHGRHHDANRITDAADIVLGLVEALTEEEKRDI